MKTKQEIAKFIKEKVELLSSAPDAWTGSYLSLEGNYADAWAVVVLWTQGWGDEKRDDAIQDPKHLDWALEARVAKMKPHNGVDDWLMFTQENGDVVDGIGLEPDDDYTHIAEFLLDQYEYIKEQESLEESFEKEKEWAFIFNVSDIENIDNPRFNTSAISAEGNRWSMFSLATTEEQAINDLKVHLSEVYGIPEESIEVTNVALQESVKESDEKNWGVMQDVEQKVYKNNPSLKLGFIVTGLTKEEAEKQAKEKNTEKLNSKGIFYHAEEVKDQPVLKEFRDVSSILKTSKALKESQESEDDQLPTEFEVSLAELGVDGADEDAFIVDYISDWLSEETGFLHYSFHYDIVGDTVYITDVLWDLSESIKEINKSSLNEGAANFGRSSIINLCSPLYRYNDFDWYVEELKAEDPEITEEEISDRIYNLITAYTDDAYEVVKKNVKDNDVEDIIEVEPGYHEGFYIKFKFKNAGGLVDEISYYDEYREDVTDTLNKKIEGMIKALTDSAETGDLVEYSVAYAFSNGETGYNTEANFEKVSENIKTAFEKLKTEGLEIIKSSSNFHDSDD